MAGEGQVSERVVGRITFGPVVPTHIARMMSEADRKAMGVTLPEQDEARYEHRAERELQRLCEQELSRRGIAFLHLSFRSRERVGWPDLTFAYRGRPYCVELKSAHGKLTPEQAVTLCVLGNKTNGAITAVCRTFDEFRKVLDG